MPVILGRVKGPASLFRDTPQNRPYFTALGATSPVNPGFRSWSRKPLPEKTTAIKTVFSSNYRRSTSESGVDARVLFSGMAPGYVGLWQINAEVPASVAPGPALPLVVTSGGVSSNTVTIAVE